MSRDSGALSIDFLAGFTIFLIAFIWVLSMIPGLLVDLQGYSIDYDAVSYRTGVILVEDPGEPPSWELAPYHEGGNQYDQYDPASVKRFGLAVSRDDPNILSIEKVNRFFESGTFSSDDYHNLAIFGDYPYKFSISLSYTDNNEPTRSIGPVVPEGYGDYGYIRRLVKIKSMSSVSIDGNDYSDLDAAHYINGPCVTKHTFAILLDNTELLGKTSSVKDPAYQINPAHESFWVHLNNLHYTIEESRRDCFEIGQIEYGDIYVSDGIHQQNINEIYIDGAALPEHLADHPIDVENHKLSIFFNSLADNRGSVNWDADKIYIYFTFNLDPTDTSCTDPTPSCPVKSGSKFLNSTIETPLDNPFEYDYSSKLVTQPELKDAIIEVAVW